jgi:two-component system NtrC family sensor kinase
MEELVRICDVDSATFRVPDEGGLRLVAAPGPFSITDALLPYQGNIPALAFEQREVIVADDYQYHPLAIKSAVERGTETAFAPPVISRGDVIGVVTVSAVHSNHFTPERVSLVLGIINGLGSLLENARLEDERKRTEERMHETARLASIGELAAGVAHEVNNPLTSVLGYSEMVLRSSIPDEYRKDIQTISDETQRAAKIVQNLLFFARKSGTEKQYIDLNSIVNRALEMKTYDFKVSNISVNSELSPKILKTMVDEHQLVQVLLNILTNAEQAIHEAGRAGHIDVRTRELDNRLEITIKDDGPGMPPEVLSKIFEPFFTTKEVGRGTGLGLSISYGIVKQHGGDVWVENSAAKGTKFHINLPVAGPEESALSQVAPAASLAKVTRHLLVVGDEPHIRDLLRRYLMSERYTVDLASGGREAWRKLTNMEYSCIILDLKMPGMSGRELYQRMRRSSQTLANKVVLISGDTISLDTRDFISQMGNPLITKPFSLGELMRTVRDFWDRLPVTA